MEWESAFNLHIKLAPLTSLVGTWSSTDRVIFIKTIRMVLKKLWEEVRQSEENAETVKHVVCNKEATCIDYQVRKYKHVHILVSFC